ncbi:olfactory receptor 5V1-like [Rana temporaria]|uniref:olfactory receptor 5V1-like n=1 Tax=Rana temporaria TaxID=8407 RepID=UPI001AACB1D0|nr:olfactory receptor 5V1-like [Rana temporaria]
MPGCPNQSAQYDFHILAFTTSPVGQLFIFIGGFLLYLMTILGNVAIFTLVFTAPKLHTPMYFFLCNISVLDVASTSNFIPKLLMILITQDHKISLYGCIIQLFFFVFCAVSELLTLTSMAYDRYLAICKPLQYYLIMSKTLCMSLIVFSLLTGALNSLVHAILTSLLFFCTSRDINNLFCELNSLISLSTSDTNSRKLLIVFDDIILAFIPFVLIIASYVFIISNVLKIKSRHGRLKAFSSCTSHLITVVLFCGPSIFLYIKEEFEHAKDQDKLLPLLFLVVVPMLNPLVYSLRNKDIWEATAALRNYKKKMF